MCFNGVLVKRQSRYRQPNAASSQIRIVIIVMAVVISIVAFLAFLRSLTQNRDYARTLICASNVRALGVAIAEFAHEHNGELPEKLEDIFPQGSFNKIFFAPQQKICRTSVTCLLAQRICGASAPTPSSLSKLSLTIMGGDTFSSMMATSN